MAEMRDEEAQMPKVTTGRSTTSLAVNGFVAGKEAYGLEVLCRRGKYKLWILAAIVCLALWSMFTGSVTLKWSAADLKHSPKDLDPSLRFDIDVLDFEERGKMVQQMWNVYKHSHFSRLPSFWRDAFGAAYQELTSEVESIRNRAVLEIAKMSFLSRNVYDATPGVTSLSASN